MRQSKTNYHVMPNRQTGVGLVEVLATLLVIAFGFLALLKLQVQTVTSVAENNQRYMAAVLAQDLGERIRANAERAADYTMSDFNTKSADCTAICSTDIDEWLNNIDDATNALKDGRGMVVYDGTSGVVIDIEWSQKGTTEKALYRLEVPINNKNV